MYILVVFLFGIGALLAMWIAGWYCSTDKSKIGFPMSVAFGIGLMFFAIILTVVETRGIPKLESALGQNAIYEVISVTPLSDGSYAVWLREQDGTERVYAMKSPPPEPRFQVRGGRGNRQYLPYPSTSSGQAPSTGSGQVSPPSPQPTN